VTGKLLRLKMTFYAMVMAPVALFGLIHNAVPYALARLGATVFRDEAVRLFAYFGLGVISFGTGYAAIAYGLWQIIGLSPWQTLVYLAALPPSGFVALRYRRNVLRYRDQILIRALFWNERELVDLLRTEQGAIRDQFAVLADRYGIERSGA
jgi:hypothetical protein